jgi:hypothetical protein
VQAEPCAAVTARSTKVYNYAVKHYWRQLSKCQSLELSKCQSLAAEQQLSPQQLEAQLQKAQVQSAQYKELAAQVTPGSTHPILMDIIAFNYHPNCEYYYYSCGRLRDSNSHCLIAVFLHLRPKDSAY